MQCPKCGYQMSAFDSVCPRCKGEGLSVAHPIPATPRATTPPQSFQPVQTLPSRGPNFGLIALILGILSILLFLMPLGPMLTSGLGIFLGLKGIKSQRGVRISKWGIGVSGFAFLLSLWLTIITVLYVQKKSEERASQQEFRKSIGANVSFSNLSATMTAGTGNVNIITVSGDVQNNQNSTRIVPVKATILNSANVAVVAAHTGVLVSGGASQHFQIEVRDRARTSPFTYKVEASME